MRPFFVANSTRGIAVIVTHGTGTPISTTNASVASGSPLCHAVTGGRSCTVTAGVAAGSDDFLVKTYDAAPVNNSFSGAKQLAVGKVTQTITKGKLNSVKLTVGGVVARGTMALATSSVPVIDNNTQTVTMGAQDADGNTIVNDGWYDAGGTAVTMALVPTDAGLFSFAPATVSFASPTSSMTYTASKATSTQVQNGFSELVWATPSNGTPHGIATLTLTKPVLTEFTTFESNSYPEGIAVGPDNAIWFVENNGNKVGRIATNAAPGSAATEFSTGITASAGLTEIATGQDGKLWFTENGQSQIGSMDPATPNKVHEYMTPSSGANPYGITTGPDGNMWFAENCSTHNNVAKFNAAAMDTGAGLIVEYAAKTAGATPQSIVAGPDGNMWFTESNDDKIGTIHTDGTGANDFALPANSIGNGSITNGPDGALWFTEENPGGGIAADGHGIGRITTAGTPATVFQFTNTFTSAQGIVTGPDGALWFVENGNDAVGRIDPSTKAVIEFPLSHNSYPWGIVKGPDGALWFTECLSGKIGRLQ